MTISSELSPKLSDFSKDSITVPSELLLGSTRSNSKAGILGLI